MQLLEQDSRTVKTLHTLSMQKHVEQAGLPTPRAIVVLGWVRRRLEGNVPATIEPEAAAAPPHVRIPSSPLVGRGGQGVSDEKMMYSSLL